MIMLWQFLALLGTHWVADFVLQTHWQATNKSKRFDALAHHVISYTAVLTMAAAIIFGPSTALFVFVVVNGFLHLGTDYFTSRWTAKLYAKQDWHNFFVVVGFDQLIHQTTLAVTMWVFFFPGLRA